MLSEKIKNLNLKGYNPNISYCGRWSLNSFRTKLYLHKILPFNKQCFLHDKGYSLLNEHFKELSLMQYLKYKFIIDYKFLKQMQEDIKDVKPGTHTFIYQNITCCFFFVFVILNTPFYYFGMRKKNK